MRPRVIAGLIALVGVGLLGAATADWLVVTVPGPVVEGIQLPAETRTLVNGAQDAPLALVSGLLTLLTALAVAVHGRVAGRTPTAGRASRMIAAVLAGAVLVTLVAAMASVGDRAVVVLGGGPPSSTPAFRLLPVGGLVVVVLTGLLWRHRPSEHDGRGASGDLAGVSRYTVEAARGEAPLHAEEAEWDAAILDDDEITDHQRTDT